MFSQVGLIHTMSRSRIDLDFKIFATFAKKLQKLSAISCLFVVFVPFISKTVLPKIAKREASFKTMLVKLLNVKNLKLQII